MKWKGGRRSSNIDDRRGQSAGIGGMSAASGLLNFLPLLIRSKSGRVILVVGVIAYFGARLLGVDLLSFFMGGGGATVSTQPGEMSAEQQEAADFASFVLADTEQTWNTIFQQQGLSYSEPTLVLFTGRVNSACGTASSAIGPFYCPSDQQLYLDLSFFSDLNLRHDAPGDFAQAYVIAHEVGHHVQTLLGISGQVRQSGQGANQSQVNALSVRQELQADCFAGLWGHAANIDRQLLDPGDLDEALTAASAIGDDRLQRQAGGSVVPDSFTHGSSTQRVRWFKRGFESGDFAACDTFAADSI